MTPVRPDGSLYSQMIITAADFATAAEEAAAWLRENEDDVAVVRVELLLSEDEGMPVYGLIRYTQA